MIKTVEVVAKKVDDAIKQACEQLGVSRDEVTIEILSSGGIFSKAKVKVSAEIAEPKPKEAVQPKSEPKATSKQDVKAEPKKAETKPAPKADKKSQPKPEPKAEAKQEPKTTKKSESKVEKKEVKADKKEVKKEAKPEVKKPETKPEINREERKREGKPLEGDGGARKFLDGLLEHMGVTGDVDIVIEDDKMNIDLKANDAALIGQRGETLSAIRYLTSLVVNQGDTQYMYVEADTQDYRARRTATLEKLAVKTADRAIRTGRKVRLEPMSSSERRIIHSTLTDRTDIICRSEGKDPRRAIAILPKKMNNDRYDR